MDVVSGLCLLEYHGSVGWIVDLLNEDGSGGLFIYDNGSFDCGGTGLEAMEALCLVRVLTVYPLWEDIGSVDSGSLLMGV